ncbi:type I polyketide synthase [Kitasatospora sp. NPDC018619]|uniref:type I polyketide synthase n=1 Tax=unclassified Kitasatospora TaxID=2633591 RepID=UPI00378C9D39
MRDLPARAVAVVGIGCRFPQADGPEAFWRLLRGGADAVSGRRGERGPARGGFLERVDGFDPAFFGISRREAVAMDPQQRLALELAWEALEDARTLPGGLRGSRTGVFLGVIADDYATLVHGLGPDAVTGHTLTGLQRGVTANRISYTLGLHGPSLVVDTGQSSSLAAVHLACASLRSGESELALAGGVSLILAPESTRALERAGTLSADGRCYTFDARADGYVRGEGGGVVVLKLLEAAVRDGDRIHAVIRGSALNNDGATQSLPTPGRASQERVLLEACVDAGVEPGEVQYVELHGSGTRAGDPVEAAALGAALGSARAEDAPLLVGSVKTNIGHLEGAAGIAGFIKTVLCLGERELVPSLNHVGPGERIPLDALRLRVNTETRDWPAPHGQLVAGVSSFGIGGTNCHVVLSDWPSAANAATETAEAAEAAAGTVPWVLSGRDGAALDEQAERLRARVAARPELGAASVGRSLAVTRTAFEHRCVVVADGRDGLLAELAGRSAGQPSAAVVEGRHDGPPVRPVFVFPGQGSQWTGMAAELLDTSPFFAERIDACAEALRPYVDWSLTDVLRGAAGAPPLEGDEVIQPALWAVMVSLAALWRSVGVEPAAVVGHSQGEIAAATAAGALSLRDGARVVALRSRVLKRIATGGGLLAVDLPAGQVERDFAAAGAPGLSVAAVNGPAHTVVAGPGAALDALAAHYGQRVRTRRLTIDYASHSPAVEELRDGLLAAFEGIAPRSTDVPFHSTVTAAPIDTAELGPGYWFRNLREPVRFGPAVERLLDAGHLTFLEVSPHPVLAMGVRQAIDLRGGDGAALSTLRRGHGGRRRFLTAAAEAFVRGVAVDWSALLPASAPLVDLPTYPFQRRSCWPSGLPGATGVEQAPEPLTVQHPLAAQDLPPAQDPLTAQDPAPAKAPDRRSALELVRSLTAVVLGEGSAADVRPGRTFRELGLDSAMTLELRDRLAAATGLDLESTVVYDHPSPADLAAVIDASSAAARAAEPPAPEATRLPAHAPDSGPAPGPEADDPVVIVGMACRFPGGVRSPEDLWDLVATGTDATGDFPDDRGWDLAALHHPDPDRVGTSYVRRGGFVRGVTDFDAEFFGISPREALAMDPQQRLLLEVGWEALERAGIDPTALKGSRTGVFAGAMHSGYGPSMESAGHGVAGHLLTGTSISVVSGRIAYVLGLNGPALTVDTACSASLVALHQAVRAVRAGECSLALAGGVTVMATPGMFVELSRQRVLAADGRCKAFSARADGTGWGEGAGMVVVERLSDARRHGHPVLAVVAGSAVNSDGASNGLSAPSGTAQQRVIEDALADAGLAPQQVDAVEAHGTGTALGDPIEANALLAAYGQGRERPLWLGSLKSNIGHAQAAAGVGGVIKMVQAIRHGALPATLHVDEPSPHVDWTAGSVALLDRARPWPKTGGPRRGGVSSFGISGTNAHVILTEPPAEPGAEPGGGPGSAERGNGPGGAEGGNDPRTAGPARPPVVPVVLSARTPQALRERARGLAGGPVDPVAAARALTARTAWDERAVVVAADRPEAERALAALARGEEAPGLVTGRAAEPGRTVLVFPGQGGQWRGMAARLAAESPVFAARLAQCERALAPYVDWSMADVLAGEPLLDRIEVVQPALWAVMVSLAELWREAGVVPDAVVGHSQGEIAAAVVAGALSLEDGARAIAVRSAVAVDLMDRGMMAVVPLPAARVRERLGTLSVAAVNGPAATAVAGDPDAITALVDGYRAEGVNARVIPAAYASHCPAVEPIRERILAGLAPLAPRAAQVALMSSVTADWQDGAGLDAAYWYRNLRHTVRFQEAVEALVASGHTTFVEVGPHPVLSGSIGQILEEAGVEGIVTGSLRRDDGGLRRFLTSAAEAHVRGLPIAWERLTGPAAGVPDLPTYPFLGRRYWLTGSAGPSGTADLGQAPADHPLLGAAVELGDGETVFTGRLSARSHPWLADHVLAGTAVLPGTAFLELALHAGAKAGTARIEELTVTAPLELPADGAVDLRVRVSGPDGEGRRTCRIAGRATGGEWVEHATGTLGAEPAGPAGPAQPGGPADRAPAPLPAGAPAGWPPAGATPVPPARTQEDLALRGHRHGPAFQGLRAAWRGADGEQYAEAVLPEPAAADAGAYRLHPALLDASLHGVLAAAAGHEGRPVQPSRWRGVSLTIRPAGPAGGQAAGPAALRVQAGPAVDGGLPLALFDAAGAPVGAVEALELAPVATGRPLDPAAAARDSLFALAWEPLPEPATQAPGTLVALPWDALDPRAPYAAAGPDGTTVVSCPEAQEGADPATAARDAVHRTRELLARWLAEDGPADGEQDADGRAGHRLVLVTRGAVAVRPGETVRDLAQAAVWGLVRTAQVEHPGRFTLVDLAPGTRTPEVPAAALAPGEHQAAVRDGAVLVPRLVPAAADPALRPPEDEAHWHLDMTERGTLAGLELRPCPEAAAEPGPGRVRVAVRAAGVNFHDVLGALDMHPDDPGPLGLEGAGVVTATGPGVTGLAVGDRVMGLLPAAFGTAAQADPRTLVRIPDGWSFTRAAAVPVAHLTALHALVELGGVGEGDPVLIHAGAGGVGLAAVQLARHLGAEVFATASPAKWPALRALGVDDDHLASSREPGFGARFAAVLDARADADARSDARSDTRPGTPGRRMALVLNSLTGELVDESLRLLRPGGLLVELGRTDRRDPAEVAAAHPGVHYRTFNLLELPPEHLARLLARTVELFDRGAFGWPAVTDLDVRRAPEAFGLLRQGSHVGKVVLTVPPVLDPDGTVLITGGTGAIGRALARHLVTGYGARRLLLAGRRGGDAPGAAELAAELAAHGAEVAFAAVDVADRAAVAAMVEAVPDRHPLTAVVHAAGVVDDAPVTSLTDAQIDRVMRVKADGAWHLHELTAGHPLTAFVLVSSVMGTLGGAGQGGYTAANAFLDGLARHRRAQGLPALALAWGLWGDRDGMLGALGEADRARFARAGLVEIAPAHGLALLDAALPSPHAVLVPARLDREVLRELGPDLPPVLRGVVADAGASRAGAGSGTRRHRPLREELDGLTAEERAGVLADLVRTHMAAVLGSRPEAIPDDRPFGELGFDSLTSVEFRNRLGTATGLKLPLTLLFEAPTLPELVAVLEAGLTPPAARPVPGTQPAAGTGPASGTQPAAGTAPDGDVAALVDAATAEELLAFIDRELI